MTQFLLQMAGRPGSGKSTISRLVGNSTRAVVLDKDVLKTAILEAGVAEPEAGPIAYEAFFDLADHLLGQGHAVVLDSPSFWESIPRRGMAVAAKRIVPYYFVECFCDDEVELARRLRERSGLRSNPGEEAMDLQLPTVVPDGAYLRLDTRGSVERSLELVLDYLG